MSNELVKMGTAYVAKSGDGALSRDVGSALVKTGVGGLALGGVAWLLPFISLPMLLVIVALLGVFLYIKD